MDAPFLGFPDTQAFLRDLRANNDRDWFNAHKATYERVGVEDLQRRRRGRSVHRERRMQHLVRHDPHDRLDRIVEV